MEELERKNKDGGQPMTQRSDLMGETYTQKHQKHFTIIIVFVPTCESIPLAPRGFDNIFFI
jgi:hypothetical protein